MNGDNGTGDGGRAHSPATQAHAADLEAAQAVIDAGLALLTGQTQDYDEARTRLHPAMIRDAAIALYVSTFIQQTGSAEQAIEELREVAALCQLTRVTHEAAS